LIHERNFSFPSGHSTAAFALYGMLAYLLIDHMRSTAGKLVLLLVAVALVLGIGISRVYLGVHYPSDVAAGYLAGFIWLATLIGADLHVRHRAKLGTQCSRCH
jgi:undecaprenyl-diphosphatase